VHLRADVIDLEMSNVQRLRHAAILAAIARPLASRVAAGCARLPCAYAGVAPLCSSEMRALDRRMPSKSLTTS
jgi:hypothetical protein